MTKEEAKKFGLQLLHGIMERNESYPVYANNVKQAIDALSEESGSSEIPNDLDEAATITLDEAEGVADEYTDFLAKGLTENQPRPIGPHWFCEYAKNRFIAGAKWQADHAPLPEDTALFNKGVAEGRRLAEEEQADLFTIVALDAAQRAKEQMLNEAVKGEYDQYPAAIYLPAPLPRMNKGDKVRVIIVKED